ncbi:hypothetical protein GGI35DRAFT_483046 [Trichoderma velutinum]
MATESPGIADYDSDSDSGSDYFVDAEETIAVTTEDVPGDSESLATIDDELIKHLDKRQMLFDRTPGDATENLSTLSLDFDDAYAGHIRICTKDIIEVTTKEHDEHALGALRRFYPKS